MPLSLGDDAYVAEGGQARVYAVGDTAFKLFTTAVPPTAKLDRLRPLAGPGIVAPEDPVFDGAGARIGFSMRFLAGWGPLIRLIPRSYRQREGLDPQAIGTLMLQLATLVQQAHATGATIVDLNPMNVLVSPDHRQVALIDVDSWALPGFPASAVAPDVVDHRATGFSAASDWYAFAVCAFQVFAGIHPYRGRHPRLTDVEARAKAGVPVFHPDVVVPPSVELNIPWRDWFEAVFSHGERTPPPPTLTAPAVRRPVRIAHRSVRIEPILTLPSPVLGTIGWDGHSWAWTADGLYQHRRRVGSAPTGLPVRTRSGLRFVDTPSRTVAHDGRLLGILGNRLVEHVPIGDGTALQPQVRASIAPHATQLFRGVAITTALGSTWVTRIGEDGTFTERWTALEGHTVLDAVHRAGVTVVITGDAHDRVQHVFGPDGHRQRPTQLHGAELVVLPSGVAAITTDDGLELFHARTPCGALRLVDFQPPAPLVCFDGQLAYHEGDTVFALSLRSA